MGGFVPSGFNPSLAERLVTYDHEGRLHEDNISRPTTGGIGDSNSLYSTEAEKFESVTPFLKRNMLADRRRRNYMVQPGGAILFDGASQPMALDVPDNAEFLGHNIKK